MNKRTIWSIMFLPLLAWFVRADTVKFEVSVSPDTITAGEFADLTIKAVDDSGAVVTDYTDDVFVDIEWLKFDNPDIVLPGGWFGFFEASDQWVKIYSKGLTIKKAWDYIINVEDALFDVNGIRWTTTIKVNEEGAWTNLGTLEVLSPTPWSSLSDETVNVIAKTSLPNTPITVFLDWGKIQEGISDQNGDVTLFLNGVTPGTHMLVVNAVDQWGSVIASSDEIEFSYKLDHGSLFVWLELTPGNTVREWEKITAKITTSDVADSVQIKIGTSDYLPTSRISDGIFQKELLMESAGKYPVWLRIWVDGALSEQDDVDIITVQEDIIKILTLNYEPDLANNKANLAWTTTWAVEYYKLNYSMDPNNLAQSVTTTEKKWVILLSDPTKPRYAQVHPVDQVGNVIGEASEIITINAFRRPEAVCGNGIIELGEECDDGNTTAGDSCSPACQLASQECDTAGIQLFTRQTDGRYYLYRSPINNAQKYLVYRREDRPNAIADMTLVWETVDPIFEYPFDPSATVDQYARYAVEAVCMDNVPTQLWDFTQVKVWPEETMMLILLSALLLLGFRKIRAY